MIKLYSLSPAAPPLHIRSAGISPGHLRINTPGHPDPRRSHRFLPGVSRQGSVYRISGIDVSEIYVDGMKLTSFDELDNIPADRIDKVRVNYLAGLNQNASVSGGIIEITLKRIPEGGYSGSVSAIGGYANYGGLGNAGMLFQARYGAISIYNSLTVNGGAMKERGLQSTLTSGGGLLSENPAADCFPRKTSSHLPRSGAFRTASASIRKSTEGTISDSATMQDGAAPPRKPPHARAPSPPPCSTTADA